MNAGRQNWSATRHERDDARRYALASRVDESRGRFMNECDECGNSFIGSRHAKTCPDCQDGDDE